jgi:hypothetical protein
LRLNSERGQSIVELAIVLPVLLLVVLAALDFGRVFLGWVVLNNAARVGANYAAIHPDAWGSPGDAAERTEYEDLVKAARADAAISLTDCDLEPVPAPVFPEGTDIGDPAELELACDFDPLTPIIGDIFAGSGNRLSVSASSIFPVRRGVLAPAGPTPEPVCPLADFEWSVSDPENDPFRVAFTDTSAGGPSSWAWDLGDGANSTLQNPERTYAAAGAYTVELTVNNCSSYSTSVILSEPPPSPDPSASPAPSPSLTPEPVCIVPGFAGTRKNDAQGSWSGRGFTTEVQFLPGPGNYKIEYQSVVGEQEAPCNIEIAVGPDPVPEP